MKNTYESPLCSRYASKRMQYIFSPDFKFSTWRKLWIALAEAEQELGLPITDAQIAQMKAHITDIDYQKANEYEKKLRHDVMAHVHTFGDACPDARPIIHLGATSCYVGDNTDIIMLREGMYQVKRQLMGTLNALADFCRRNRDIPTLAYTHFQAAQPTTVGKRATLWAQDLLYDLERLDFETAHLKLLGCKGTTGTGASFLSLFEGDAQKVMDLEKRIAKKMDFDACVTVSGQTYTRKIDSFVLSVLSGIAQSATKITNDLRLLSHLKEFDEPFESGQIGSSAMAYKRNPMRCERICSLARYVICDSQNAAMTAAAQWLERTLDDSANRRLSLPEAFLAVDAILNLLTNVIANGTIYPHVAHKHLMEELPFMASENIMMHAVKCGEDRQDVHEAVRQYSVQIAKRVKLEGADNNLLELLLADARFHLDEATLSELCRVDRFIGLAPMQVDLFLAQELDPVLQANASYIGEPDAIEV